MYTKSKYSPAQTQMWTVAAMVVLNDSREAMTCDQIRQGDMCLVDLTPQKLARILSDLVNAGFVARTKGKDGRMKYKSVGVLIEEGYELSKMVY